MEKEEEKQIQNENQEVQKEVFEPMEVNVTDVVVEKGYATSGPIVISEWNDGNW